MTLTVTFDAANSRVQLAATGLPVLPGLLMWVERRVSGGAWTPVRGGFPTEATGTGTIDLDDYEFVPNQQNEYRIRTDIVYDTFTRTVADSWGTADSGQVYTQAGGVATDYSVGSGIGVMEATTTNFLRAQYVTVVPDTDSVVDVAVDQVATGAELHVGLTARRSAGPDFYFADVRFETDSTIQLTIGKRVSGVQTALDIFLSDLTYVPDQFFRLRFKVQGGFLYAKVWDPTEDEPGNWQVTFADSELPGGSRVAPRSYSAFGNTNTNPDMLFDNFHSLDIGSNPTHSILETANVTPTQTETWLKFPLRPFLNRVVNHCDWTEEVRPARGSVFEILGRRDPVAVTEVRGSRRFTSILAAEDASEADDIELSLSFGGVIFLQTPGDRTVCSLTRRAQPKPLYAFVGDVTIRHLRGVAPYIIELPLIEVAPPSPELAAVSVTWLGIQNAFATWGDVISTFPTWLDVISYLSDPSDEVVG